MREDTNRAFRRRFCEAANNPAAVNLGFASQVWDLKGATHGAHAKKVMKRQLCMKTQCCTLRDAENDFRLSFTSHLLSLAVWRQIKDTHLADKT